MQKAVGTKIKKLRCEQKRTLKDLSVLTGLSISYLSQVERGLCSASLDSLDKVAAALGAPTGFFIGSGLDNSDAPAPVFCGSEQELELDLDQRLLRCCPGNDRPDFLLIPQLFTILPASEEDPVPFLPPYMGEGLIYVLQGVLDLRIDGQPTVLNAGDSMHFVPESKDYIFFNSRKKLVSLLYVSFRR